MYKNTSDKYVCNSVAWPDAKSEVFILMMRILNGFIWLGLAQEYIVRGSWELNDIAPFKPGIDMTATNTGDKRLDIYQYLENYLVVAHRQPTGRPPVSVT